MVSRGRKVERRREVWEWQGLVYAHAEMGAPSMFRFLPAITTLAELSAITSIDIRGLGGWRT